MKTSSSKVTKTAGYTPTKRPIMPKYRMLRPLPAVLAATILTAAAATQSADPKDDKSAIDRTSEAVRAAFARGDIPAILSYIIPM